MTNLAVIENKISAVKKYLKILERYGKYSVEEIRDDVDIRGMVERYLYLAAQSTIDLAESIIAYRKFRKPTTMSEAFYILEEEGIIPAELNKKMVGMVGFRNVIAHDYDKIDYDIVYSALREGIKDIERFVDCVRDL